MIGIIPVPHIGTPYCYECYDSNKRKDKCIGYVLGTRFDTKLAYIWFIYVRDNQRRKGFGSMMVNFLQGELPDGIIMTSFIEDFKGFECIKTQIGGTHKESVAMLKKCGFVRKDGDYVWER